MGPHPGFSMARAIRFKDVMVNGSASYNWQTAPDVERSEWRREHAEWMAVSRGRWERTRREVERRLSREETARRTA